MLKEDMIREAVILREKGFPPSDAPMKRGNAAERQFQVPVGERMVTVYEFVPETKTETSSTVLINFHGGGFVKGRAERDSVYCSNLAEQLKIPVWDVDYALSPEYPYPTALEDAWEVCAFAVAQGKRVMLAGHSAGGNLAVGVCILDGERDQIHPLGLLAEYFPADMATDPMSKLSKGQLAQEKEVMRARTGQMYNLFYCGEQDGRDPLISPLFAEEGQLKGFPDTMVLSAGKDKLREEDEMFALKLAAAGVKVLVKRYGSSPHGFTINRNGQWEEALGDHLEFIRACVAKEEKKR